VRINAGGFEQLDENSECDYKDYNKEIQIINENFTG